MNVLLTIEYDGTCFSGWQRQPGLRTVQGTVEEVLTGIIGRPVTVDGVSRTDAGVHARDQKALLRTELRIPVERLAMVVNAKLQGRPEARSENDDVRIVDAREVPDSFSIRGDVAGKTYRYAIRNAWEMPVFDRNFRYNIKQNLDPARMRAAAEYIKGTHDFRCFQAAGGEPGKTTVRTISDITITEKILFDDAPSCVIPLSAGRSVWTGASEKGTKKEQEKKRDRDPERGPANEQGAENCEHARDIFIDITGDGFLYNMVRIITGTLVEVGLGKREPEDVKRIIEGKDRREAGHTAPPRGLTLMKVYFDEDRSSK